LVEINIQPERSNTRHFVKSFNSKIELDFVMYLAEKNSPDEDETKP